MILSDQRSPITHVGRRVPQEGKPTFMALWDGWRVAARKIGYVQSHLSLTLAYFVVLAPFALAVRLFMDPLRLRGASALQRFPEGDRPVPTLDWDRRQS